MSSSNLIPWALRLLKSLCIFILFFSIHTLSLSPSLPCSFKQIIPKLDPPPPPINRKRSIRTLSPGSESDPKPSATPLSTPTPTMSNGSGFPDLCISSSFPDAAPSSVSPGNSYSLTSGGADSGSVSCSASEDSGMRSEDKSLASPPTSLLPGDDPFEDHGSAFLSASSTCSSLPEDRIPVGFATETVTVTPPRPVTPHSFGHTLPFSSPLNDTCLHISLSEDELLESTA